MPIASFTADQAMENLRRSRASIWPDDRVPGERLTGVAKVELKPSFQFSRADRVLTLGSCFAREMEVRLIHLGFDAPLARVSVPAEERNTKMQNDILIKYTIESMENELRWAAGEAPPPPEKLFLEVADGLWHDPQLLHSAPPLPMQRLLERRAMVQEAMETFPTCRVVIITLGLAEAWFDEETGLYLNTAPPPGAMRRCPGRFRLDVLSHDDILNSLERVWDLLAEKGAPDVKMLLTVSPVPFKATFTGEDAIMANSYSKSVQRAAAQAFAQRHEGVDYFPSYEIVTMTSRELAYERDNAHVTLGLVNNITDNVLKAYAGIEVDSGEVRAPNSRQAGAQGTHFDLFVLTKHHMAAKEYPEAEAACRDLLRRFGETITVRERGITHFLLARALNSQQRLDEAIEEYRRAAELDPQDGLVYYKLGQCYEKLDRWPEALAAFERAAAINSQRPEYANKLQETRERIAGATVPA
jgi:tetratricopeptide (TPR) repeat protein